MDRLAAGLDRQLHPAGALQVQHQDEGFRNGASERHQTVVAQDHGPRGRAEIGHQPVALGMVERDALELVVRHAVVELQRPLVARLQPAGQRRHAHAGDRVGVQHAGRVVARRVDGAVDREAGRVHVVRRVVEDAAFEVDLHQRRRGDVLEQRAVGVDQKLVVRARHARRNVRVDAVVHAVVRNQAVGGGQVDAHLAFGVGRRKSFGAHGVQRHVCSLGSAGAEDRHVTGFHAHSTMQTVDSQR